MTRTCIHYFHSHLLCPKNAATALKMLARCSTLLCFLPCIHAFMSSNLPMKIMNTGSKNISLNCAKHQIQNAKQSAVAQIFSKKKLSRENKKLSQLSTRCTRSFQAAFGITGNLRQPEIPFNTIPIKPHSTPATHSTHRAFLSHRARAQSSPPVARQTAQQQYCPPRARQALRAP